MIARAESILVLGDLHFDKVYWSVEPSYVPPPSGLPRWREQTGCHFRSQPGGAWLLDQIILHALALTRPRASRAEEELYALRELLDQELKAPPPGASSDTLPETVEKALLSSVASLWPYTRYGTKVNKDKVYRIREILGWERHLGVDSAVQHRWNAWLLEKHIEHRLKPLRVGDNHKQPVESCVLCDRNHGFRDTVALDRVFQTEPKLILLQMSTPLAQGALWNRLSHDEHCARAVVVVSANCLRAAGARIEYKSSVERTTADFACTLHHHELVRELGTCAHLLVRFQHGVLHWDSQARTITCSFSEYAAYDPQQAANGAAGGHTSLLIATLAEALARRSDRKQTVAEALHQGAQKAVVLNEWHYWNGYGPKDFETNKCFRDRVDKGRPVPYDQLFDEFATLEQSWRKALPDDAKTRPGGPTPLEASEAAKKLVAYHKRDLPKYGFEVAQITVALPALRGLDRWSRTWNRCREYLDAQGVAAVDLGTRIVLEGLATVFGDTKKALDSNGTVDLFVVARYGH